MRHPQCNHRAKHSFGRGLPKESVYNICDACLEDSHAGAAGGYHTQDDLQQYIDDRLRKAQSSQGIDGDRCRYRNRTGRGNESIAIHKENPHPELYYLQEDGSIITRSEMEIPDIPPDGEEIPLDDLPFSDDLEAELVGSYTYKELQGMAKELGIPSFGVKKDELQESVLKALKER